MQTNTPDHITKASDFNANFPNDLDDLNFICVGQFNIWNADGIQIIPFLKEKYPLDQ